MKSKKFWAIVLLVGYNQQIVAGQDAGGSVQDKAAVIGGYVRLAAAVVQQSYQFFVHEKKEYDLQEDVLNVPYKNMVYASTESIEQAFNDANKHDNPQAQIKAIIGLCRMPVCQWYLKSFQKGLDQLYAVCFDEFGNFKDTAQIQDIRVIFKDYCKKAPTCWQDIASISMWWCKNKSPYAIHTKYYAQTCTEFNEDLLAMIAADPIQDLVYLKYLSIKYDAPIVAKMYQAHVTTLLKYSSESSKK